MRYFQKLLCLLILVLAASFGVGGCVLLYSDFSVQRSRMAAANAAAHAQACTLLQTEILDLQRRGISTGDAALTARVTAQDVPAALWRGDTLDCATLEGLQSLPLGDAATVTVRTENSIYAVYASDLQGGLRLVTAYDLTGLYRDRNAALMRFLLLEAAVLAAASAVTALLARRLTRPLAVLTDAGAQIAAGDYARRTDLHTGDEIEALSRSFDKMADAVQEKIADLEADVQRRACVFCPDEAMCGALREALGDRFGLDDRQTRPQVVTLYAQALERAFPEIYTHVTPLVSRREAKMAREVIAQQRAARGAKKGEPESEKSGRSEGKQTARRRGKSEQE